MPVRKKDLKLKRDKEYYDNLQIHRKHVKELLFKFADALKVRGKNHDISKLEEPEFSIMAKNYASLRGTTYGTQEYNELLDKIKPALESHYAKNRHHPEHWPNGIKDMNLLDLIEMFVDWYSATKKHDDGNIRFSIEHNKERFGYTKELEQIFINSIELLDIKDEEE